MRFLSNLPGFVFEFFLGCRHGRLTRPFTIRRETYKVCLDCGRQVFYSPITMRPLSMGEMRRRRRLADSQKAPAIHVNTTIRAMMPVREGEPNAAA